MKKFLFISRLFFILLVFSLISNKKLLAGSKGVQTQGVTEAPAEEKGEADIGALRTKFKEKVTEAEQIYSSAGTEAEMLLKDTLKETGLKDSIRKLAEKLGFAHTLDDKDLTTFQSTAIGKQLNEVFGRMTTPVYEYPYTPQPSDPTTTPQSQPNIANLLLTKHQDKLTKTTPKTDDETKRIEKEKIELDKAIKKDMKDQPTEAWDLVPLPDSIEYLVGEIQQLSKQPKQQVDTEAAKELIKIIAKMAPWLDITFPTFDTWDKKQPENTTLDFSKYNESYVDTDLNPKITHFKQNPEFTRLFSPAPVATTAPAATQAPTTTTPNLFEIIKKFIDRVNELRGSITFLATPLQLDFITNPDFKTNPENFSGSIFDTNFKNNVTDKLNASLAKLTDPELSAIQQLLQPKTLQLITAIDKLIDGIQTEKQKEEDFKKAMDELANPLGLNPLKDFTLGPIKTFVKTMRDDLSAKKYSRPVTFLSDPNWATKQTKTIKDLCSGIETATLPSAIEQIIAAFEGITAPMAQKILDTQGIELNLKQIIRILGTPLNIQFNETKKPQCFSSTTFVEKTISDIKISLTSEASKKLKQPEDKNITDGLSKFCDLKQVIIDLIGKLSDTRAGQDEKQNNLKEAIRLLALPFPITVDDADYLEDTTTKQLKVISKLKLVQENLTKKQADLPPGAKITLSNGTKLKDDIFILIDKVKSLSDELSGKGKDKEKQQKEIDKLKEENADLKKSIDTLANPLEVSVSDYKSVNITKNLSDGLAKLATYYQTEFTLPAEPFVISNGTLQTTPKKPLATITSTTSLPSAIKTIINTLKSIIDGLVGKLKELVLENEKLKEENKKLNDRIIELKKQAGEAEDLKKSVRALAKPLGLTAYLVKDGTTEEDLSSAVVEPQLKANVEDPLIGQYGRKITIVTEEEAATASPTA